MLFLNLLLLLLSIIILARSSLFLVRSLVSLAGFFRLSEFSVAFILMATATSLPEIFVGISAAVEGVPSLVLGNAIGSNIVNLTLVFGIVILVSGGMHARSVIARKDSLYMLLFASAPIFLILDGTLTRGDSVVLLILYGVYLSQLLEQRSAFHEVPNHVSRHEALKNMVIFIAGAGLLLVSAQLLVSSAKYVAQEAGFSIGIVGLLIVAFGTSLPELSFQLRAIRQHEDSMVLGNLIGSVINNSTLVLAITGLIRPISVPQLSPFVVPVIFFLVIMILFEYAVSRDRQLGLIEGLGLIFMYIFFLISELGFGFFISL